MATPLNKKSLAFLKESTSQLTAKVTVMEDRLFFNKKAVKIAELEEGTYIEFIDTEKDWLFIANEDSDGFKLARYKKDRDGLTIYSSALVRVFLKQNNFTKAKLPLHFVVYKTDKSEQGYPVSAVSITK